MEPAQMLQVLEALSYIAAIVCMVIEVWREYKKWHERRSSSDDLEG